MTETVTLRVIPKIAATPDLLAKECAKSLRLDARRVKRTDITRRSIDARQRQVYVNLTVVVHIDSIDKTAVEFIPTVYPSVADKPQAIIVGAGPAGLFAALELILLGVRPIILERGKDVDSRRADMVAINRTGVVNPTPIIALAKAAPVLTPTENFIPEAKSVALSKVCSAHFISMERKPKYWSTHILTLAPTGCRR